MPLYSIVTVDDTLFAAGENGTVLKLVNDRWQFYHHGKPIRFYLRAMASLNNDKLLIAGGAGALHIISVDQMRP